MCEVVFGYCKTWNEVRKRKVHVCTNGRVTGEGDDESVESLIWKKGGGSEMGLRRD